MTTLEHWYDFHCIYEKNQVSIVHSVWVNFFLESKLLSRGFGIRVEKSNLCNSLRCARWLSYSYFLKVVGSMYSIHKKDVSFSMIVALWKILQLNSLKHRRVFSDITLNVFFHFPINEGPFSQFPSII